MWFIIAGDGDIDYTRLYGPFASHSEAEDIVQNKLPEDDGGDVYRTINLESLNALEEFYID